MVAKVSIKDVKVYNPEGEINIIAVDVGLKFNQLRCLYSRGAKVTLVPWDYDFTKEKFDGLFLSNGPGDPIMADKTIEHVKTLMETQPTIPIFGICLGHQLLSLASGAKTYKLPYGNRGHNQPCVHEDTKKCYITSQNHGFATDASNLPAGWHALFTNANDHSNEGIVHGSSPWFSVQFHPEAAAGPRDLECLFDVFVDATKAGGKGPIIRKAITEKLVSIERECLNPDEPPARPNKVLVLGSGGLSIGQAGEFDYSGSQAIKALKEEGIMTVLINPNIATVQTMKGLADKVYFLPVTPAFVEEIIIAERPDGVLLSFGGQTALNCAIELENAGIFERYGVKVLGTPVRAIEDTEDRELFAQKVATVGETTCPAHTCANTDEVLAAAEQVGYPIMMRSSFALGGLGSGVVNDAVELKRMSIIAFSNTTQVTIEKSCRGWKEIEYEVVRDAYDNTITVCNMENFDPLGIHTGESIVIAPSQTLSNDEYNMLRDCAVKVVRMLGIVGECNIQYALNPHSKEYFIIEVNARLSRSSALASKATGYPLAYVAAKLALGISLPDLRNSVTKKTTACFEPSLDYCVVKVPRWDLGKFPGVDRKLGTAMKSVGEVMAIGRTFEEAFQKSLRMIDIGVDGFDAGRHETSEAELQNPSDYRFLVLASALNDGYTTQKLHELTKIDMWFLTRLEAITKHGKLLETFKQSTLPVEHLVVAKKLGFSDKQIGRFVSGTELGVRALRKQHGLRPVVKQIDTVAAEYPAQTNYLYLTYHGDENDVEMGQNFTMVLGSGVYRIGSSVEFDYCAVGGVRELRKLGKKTIMVNYNPETVSTDYDECDRLYFDQLTFETVMDIYEMENIDGVILALGGQIPNNMAVDLHRQRVKIFGTSPEMIDGAENRFKFSRMCDSQMIDQPKWKELTDVEGAHKFATEVTYPCLMRPSYILSGVGMRVVYSKSDLERDFKDAQVVSRDFPVVLTKFILDAKEIEVDAVAQNGVIIAYAISEHVENAGVHSGDASIIHPPQDLTEKTMQGCLEIAGKVAKSLQINGPMNIQFIAKNDELKVIECNVRVSRSFPFVSKTMGVDLIAIATRVMIGVDPKVGKKPVLQHVGVKVPQFSFSRLAGADPTVGVDMISTGEVACFGLTKEEAYLKAMQATTFVLPDAGCNILLSIGSYAGKREFVHSARLLAEAGYQLFGSLGTADFYRAEDIEIAGLEWLQDASEELAIQDQLIDGQFGLIVNLPMRSKYRRPGTMTGGAAARRGAVDHKIPLITDIKCAKLFVNALVQCGTKASLSSVDCQDSHEILKFPGLVAVHLPITFDSANSKKAMGAVSEAALKGGFTSAVIIPQIDSGDSVRAFAQEVSAQSSIDYAILAVATGANPPMRGVKDGSPNLKGSNPKRVRSISGGESSPPASPRLPVAVTSSPRGSAPSAFGGVGRGRSFSTSSAGGSSDEQNRSIIDDSSPVGVVLSAAAADKSLLELAEELEPWPRHLPIIVEAKGHKLSAAVLFSHLNGRAVHIANVSSSAEMDLVKSAKAKGIRITCSAFVSALFPTSGDIEDIDAAEDLWSSIGNIDIISIGLDCPFDIEMVLPLLVAAATKRSINVNKLVAKLTTNPAKIFGLEIGAECYVEVQLGGSQTELAGGYVVNSRVSRTVVDSEAVYLDGRLFANPGDSTHLTSQPDIVETVADTVAKPTLSSTPTNAAKSSATHSPSKVHLSRASVFQPNSRPSSPMQLPQFSRARPTDGIVAVPTQELAGRHVTKVSQLSRNVVKALFNHAHDLRFADPASFNNLLKGKVLATIFYEPSTRTHCSFQSAMQRLGGSVITLDQLDNTSLKKGETFEDFVRTMCCYTDAIVLRHPAVGQVDKAAQVSSVPVLNAGDGIGEHPTQALLDVFTMREELGTVNGLTITMMGDLKHSRTVHSLVRLLADQYRVKLRFVSPATLEMPADVIADAEECGIEHSSHASIEEVLAETDVLYVTRVQKERFANPADYEKIQGSYTIDASVMSKAKEKMVLMHPLPRVGEISSEVDSDPRAAYFRQMEYGVAVRMALLGMVMGKL